MIRAGNITQAASNTDSSASGVTAALAFVEPLALPGIAIIVLYLAAVLMGRAGMPSQPFKFVEYGLLGVTLIATLLGLANAGKLPAASRRRLIGVSACIAVVACGEYALFASDWFCVICAAIQLPFAMRLGWFRPKSQSCSAPSTGAWESCPLSGGEGWGEMDSPITGGRGANARLIAAVVMFLVGLAAWTTAVHMPWWSEFGYLRTSIPYYRGTFAVTYLFVLCVCYARNQSSTPPGHPVPNNGGAGVDAARPAALLTWRAIATIVAARGIDAVVLSIIAAASLRTAGLFSSDPHNWQAFHHWGVFVAPVEMVRQGGWLLWDVPSQYGFLSTLFLVVLPFHSMWTELHVVIGVFQTTFAFMMYTCLTLLIRHALRRLLAAALTVGTFFVMPCYGVVLGPQVMPSTTAFRFVWVYVVIGALCLVYRARAKAIAGENSIGIFSRPVVRLLIAGSVAWGVGVLWSYESAYWVSAAWLPAYGLILWQEWRRPCQSECLTARTRRRRRMGMFAALPVGIIALALTIIELVYRIRLGHGPDWSCYGDYVRAFSSGFGEMAMNYQGPIWVVFVCCMIPAVTALTLFRRLPTDPAVPVFVGAAAAVFAVASYCMGRSHTNNVLNILPVCFIAASMALRMERRLGEGAGVSLLARTCLVPFFAVVISSSIGIPTMMQAWWTGTIHPGAIAVDSRVPHFGSEATALLAKAHVGDGAPLAVLDLNLPRLTTGSAANRNRPFWTPLSPCGAVTPLSQERAERYMARYVDRTRLGGWLLIPRHADFEGFYVPWVIPSLKKFYRPTKTFTSSNYTLTYFEPI